MSWKKSNQLGLLALLACMGFGRSIPAVELTVEDAWKTLPSYQYGQDMAALLTIDREVIRAMASADSRSQCAARLAALLELPQTTPAASQYICNQLRQVGTAAQVPLLARLLAKDESCEMARHALEAIPGTDSLQALRAALDTLQGQPLVGVINSLAARADLSAIPQLEVLAAGKDPQVAAAAIWALGLIGPDDPAVLESFVANAPKPLPPSRAVSLLRLANALASKGKAEAATAIYAKLSEPGQPAGVRRAALLAQLPLEGEPLTTALLAWLRADDTDRRVVAASRLSTLNDNQLDLAVNQLGELPASSQRALIEVLAARRGQQAFPLVLSMAKSDKPGLRLAGLRCLGEIGDASVIPLLVESLAGEGEESQAAQQALATLPRKEVGDAMLTALVAQPKIRGPVIEVLKAMRYYEAIDPLLALAAQDEPDVYNAALDGLRGIADPDEHDVPRLVRLLLATSAGRHREEVEKTILIVCDKLPAGTDRAPPVLNALAKMNNADERALLSLLGRLGGPESLTRIQAALQSSDKEIRDAAVRGICNWPNADVAPQLLELASGENINYRRMALRAYVRVASLKSDRPEQQTLAMLQNAMKLATSVEDRQLIIERASAVRTLESVNWISSFLDDPTLTQSACTAIVELAHHRFLRHPNMDRFGPLLDRAIATSSDPQIVERAKRYKLGL